MKRQQSSGSSCEITLKGAISYDLDCSELGHSKVTIHDMEIILRVPPGFIGLLLYDCLET